MRLQELIAGTGAEPFTQMVKGWESIRICDITEDSRTAVPGSLFVARAGLKADGRRFVDDAIRAGAVAVLTDDAADVEASAGVVVVKTADVPTISGVLAERFYGRPSSKLDVIAVTGTNGKSTTTFLVWKMLNAAGRRAGLIGTVITDD